MVRKVAAIVTIFLFSSMAWLVLGGTIMYRSGDAGSRLGPRVQSAWGKPQTQTPPVGTAARIITKTTFETVGAQTITKKVEETVYDLLPVERSRVRAGLDLEQRKKGLLWFPTYRIAFHGDYLFRNTSTSDDVTLRLVFPVPDAIYDDLVFRVNGRAVPTTMSDGAVTAQLHTSPGSIVRLETGYRSQGLDTWRYSFGANVVQVRDFVLEMTTDFDAIDFPQGTISPTQKTKTADGWLLRWKYTNLVSGYQIGMVMPEKLQPGPLAGRISFFAPVSLLFFFFLIFIITSMKKINLHPMHYFFLATSFFAFHLLLAYLVDHISIHAAFAISSVVSIFLVVSYLRIVAGPRFAFVEAALSQLIYLVGFSYAFFFQGFTGLAITIGAIVTLFVVMQMTARVDWGAQRNPGMAAAS